MKYLDKVQKCVKVLHILAMIHMIASFIVAFFCLAGIVLWVRWNHMPADNITILNQIMSIVDSGDYYLTLSELIADFAGCLCEGFLLCNVISFLHKELEEGTPFTQNCASLLRRVGILTIILSLIASVVQTIPYTAFELEVPAYVDNESSILLGLVLLFMALILRCGAELTETGKDAD